MKKDWEKILMTSSWIMATPFIVVCLGFIMLVFYQEGGKFLKAKREPKHVKMVQAILNNEK